MSRAGPRETYNRRPVPTTYDQRWLEQELGNISRATPSYARLPGEDGVQDVTYPVGWLPRYGASLDSTTVDSKAMRRAVASAIQVGFPEVIVPYGRARITEQITMSSAVTIRGYGGIAGGLNAGASSFPTILKDFVGNLFVFDGANGNTQGSGGGVERLRIVQINGTAATTGGVGSAIKITGIDSGHRASWVKLLMLIIEESGAAPWTWGIEVDGAAFGILDLYFWGISAHTTGASPTAGAMRLNGAQQPVIEFCNFFDSGALIRVGDTNASNSVQLVGVSTAGTLAMDNVNDLGLVGGIYTAITNTANSLGNNSLAPTRLVTQPFVDNSSGHTTLWTYNPSLSDGLTAGAFAPGQAIALRNAAYLQGVKQAGGNTTKSIVGLDTGDNVRLAPASDSVVAVGSAANFTNMVGGDFAVAGKVRVGGTPFITTGTGSPETVVTAPIGSLFLRTNGGASTTLYVKESGTGNTGWIAK